MVAQKQKTIILVEDESWVAEVYQLQLESAGFKVRVAPHAQAAIDVIDDCNNVALVMLDLFLPEHNGFSVLHHLQSYDDWQRIPVVIFSNVNQRDVRLSDEQWSEYGVVWYAEKHRVHPKDVVEKVKAIVDHEPSTN